MLRERPDPEALRAERDRQRRYSTRLQALVDRRDQLRAALGTAGTVRERQALYIMLDDIAGRLAHLHGRPSD
jgi:hypothetical protein